MRPVTALTLAWDGTDGTDGADVADGADGVRRPGRSVTTAQLLGTRDQTVPAALPAAPGPIEARLLVTSRTSGDEVDTVFADLPRFLAPGDVLVVNISATLPAAVPTGDGLLLHVSSELPAGLRLVELRQPDGVGSRPFSGGRPGVVRLPGGGRATLLVPYPPDGSVISGTRPPRRLWVAQLELPGGLLAYLAEHGHPVRYGSPETARRGAGAPRSGGARGRGPGRVGEAAESQPWPLDAYQTVFATEPGSAEMPSAGRGFTAELVTALVAAGVVFAPVVLHCGVSSPEAGEAPQPEVYRVPATTAAVVNAARAGDRRVIAVGTTATRALETTADEAGAVHPGAGWTELVITPERGVRAVDGLVTGWHEPEASHLDLIEAVAGRATLERSYAAASALGYHGHEFGDFHLVLP